MPSPFRKSHACTSRKDTVMTRSVRSGVPCESWRCRRVGGRTSTSGCRRWALRSNDVQCGNNSRTLESPHRFLFADHPESSKRPKVSFLRHIIARTDSADLRHKTRPYEVVEPLGASGAYEVCRARDTRLGRDVSVKVLPGIEEP